MKTSFPALLLRYRSGLIYGVVLAALLMVLKLLECQFFVKAFTLELYLGLVTLFFTVLGAWLGLRITRNRPAGQNNTAVDVDAVLRGYCISRREYEVLKLIAGGLSNQEITDALLVSIHTVISHTSNLFVKLGAVRRIQAIEKAKRMGIIG